MPNVGLRPQLLKFLMDKELFGKKNDMTVFVLPVFEVKSEHQIPHDKKDLIQGVSWFENIICLIVLGYKNSLTKIFAIVHFS